MFTSVSVQFDDICALITPPVGMVLFVSSNVSGNAGEISREVVPFVISAMIVVILIAFIPQLVTFLPDLLL